MFAQSSGTDIIGWRFHLADLCPKQLIYKPVEVGW
jgi:hypothetical protein